MFSDEQCANMVRRLLEHVPECGYALTFSGRMHKLKRAGMKKIAFLSKMHKYLGHINNPLYGISLDK